MDPFSIAMLVFAAISTIVGAVSTGAANAQNLQNTHDLIDKQNEFSKEAAETANEETINRYNILQSPESMVKQYKTAGLSPSLMYSNGGGGSVTGAAQASTTMANVPTMNPLLDLNSMTNAVNKAMENTKTKTDTEKTEEEILNLKKVREEIDKNMAKADAEIKLIEEQTNTQVISQANLKLQNDLLELQKDYDSQTLTTRINTCKESLNLIIAQEEETWEKVNSLSISNKYAGQLYHWQIEKLKAEQQKLLAEKTLVVAQELLTKWQKNKTILEADLIGKEGDIKETEKTEAYWKSKKSEQEYWETKYNAQILEEKVKEYQKYGAKIMESNGWAQTLTNLVISLGYKLDKDTNSGGI